MSNESTGWDWDDEQEEVFDDTEPSYETSMWNGMVNYHCPNCKYSNLNKQLVDAHIDKCLHGPKGPWEPLAA